jgi:hypothetical protein
VVFKRVIAMALRVWAVVIALGAVLSGIVLLRNLWNLGNLSSALAGIVTVGLLVVFIYMVTHTIWLRAGAIKALPDASYTVIPIVVVLLKLSGEVTAIVFGFYGALGMLTAWLLGGYGGGLPFGALGSFGYGFAGGGPFLGGVAALIFGATAGFLSLVIYYLLAELVGALADIATNVAALRRKAEA